MSKPSPLSSALVRGLLLRGPFCAFCCGPSKQGVVSLDVVQFRNRRRERRFYNVVANCPSYRVGCRGWKESLRQNPWQQLWAPLLPCLVKNPACLHRCIVRRGTGHLRQWGMWLTSLPSAQEFHRPVLCVPKEKKVGPPSPPVAAQ